MDEKLPDGWMWTTIGDVAETTSGGTPLRSHPQYYGGTIPWVKSGELRDGIIDKVEEYLSKEGLSNSSAKLFPKGIALVAMYGATVGRTGILGMDATSNQAVCALLPVQEAFLAKYMTYWLQFQRQELISRSAGGAQPNVNQEIIRSFPFPLAPVLEQPRIIAAIEQQFTRLDSAVASLQSARARVKQYRASLLKSAVEGELTKEWRVEHPAEETGEQLLKRILIERRARWEEAELAKMREKGIAPKDNKWKQAYKEPQGPDMEKLPELPELPEGWCWATVEQVGDANEQVVLTGPFGSTLGKDDFKKDGIPLLTIGCLTEQGLSLKKAFYVSEEKASELGRYRVRTRDILFSRMASVGRADLVPQELEGSVINYHLMRLRLSSTAINPLYFISFIRGSKIVTDYIREVNHGVTRDGINTTQLLGLPIAVPSFSEQVQIVAEVEASLSNIAKLEETTENNLKRAEHERQSILQEAFAGRLVLQDMDDEPASVLLERIRDERKKSEEAEKVVKASRKGDHVGVAKRRKADRVVNGQQNVGLYEKLVEVGQPLAPDDLFKQVGLKADEQPESVERFYEELHADVMANLIEEERPATDRVLLHVVEQDDESKESDSILANEMLQDEEWLLPNLEELEELGENEIREARDLPLLDLEKLPEGKMRKARKEDDRRPSLWDE